MSSMTLIALRSEKDEILNGLLKTKAVQICGQGEYADAAETDETVVPKEWNEEEERARKAVDFLFGCLDALPREEREKYGAVKAISEIGADEFLETPKNKKVAEEIILRAERAEERVRALNAEIQKLSEEIRGYSEYAGLDEKFSAFGDTEYAKVALGIIAGGKEILSREAFSNAGGIFGVLGNSAKGKIVFAVYLKKQEEEAAKILSDAGFKRCPYDGDFTADEKINSLNSEILKKRDEIAAIKREAAKDSVYAKDLRVYIDYIGYLKEKAANGENIRKTESTFILKAFVPTEERGKVEKAIEKNSTAAFTSFKEIARTEFAPTLMKNNKVVRNFEAVTNMYSVPSYGALDPNGVMSFFFSLFMGLIMGDAGYGLLMIIGGLFLSKKSREGTTVERFGKVFALGGAFAVLFGFLFDSFLGFNILRNALGEGYNAFYSTYIDAINAKSSLVGIDIPSMLLWCLGLGAFQIAISLILKAVQSFGRGKIAEGIFGGLTWAFALVFAIATVAMLVSGKGDITVFAYITAALFAVGILTSGIGEKGFKKATKTFGALYGLINYMSDILSYARLYGLMLSGAQIASIFTNTLAIGMLFPHGAVGVVFGVILIVAGNLFNLAISLLGAFIHDSRLQYVEFFGRFYEGEGELFSPFGSRREFLYFK